MRWGDLSGGARAALLAVAVVALNLVLVLIGTATGREGGQPVSSVSSDDADGLSGYAELLERAGYEVVLTDQRLRATNLDPRGTLVISDPGFVEGVEAQAINDFAAKGGRVVLAGRTTATLVRRLGGAEMLRWRPVATSADPAHAVVPAPEVAGVNAIVGSTGEWHEVGGLLPIVMTTDGGTVALVGTRGAGEFVAVADSAPLQNDHLGEADNAAFGLGLAGPADRPVTFVQPRTGPTGLGAIPRRWRLSALVLVLAISLALWSAGKRTIVPGPPTLQGPSRVDYVHALGGLLTKAASTSPKGPHP